MTKHGRVSEYLDGALGADVDAFLEHLAGCTECQEELEAEVQLRDREDAVRDAPGSSGYELHGRTGEYLDDILDREAEAAFLNHVAACGLCQRELHDEVQLRDREDALREVAAAVRGDRVSAPRDSENTGRSSPVLADSRQQSALSVGVELSLRSRLRRRRVVWVAGIILGTAGAARDGAIQTGPDNERSARPCAETDPRVRDPAVVPCCGEASVV
jgi:hypothetical protein